jgi:hypothetical protein
MSKKRATTATKKTSDSTAAGRAESGEANKAKTSDAPGSEKPSAPAPREKTPIRLTEKGQLLMKELGINDPDLLMGLLQQIRGASQKGAENDQTNFDFTLAFVKGSKPRDPIESALETQMSVTHQQFMRFASRLNNARTEHELRLYEPIYIRFARTYASQVDALKRYRSKDEPGVTVQTVSVQDGGQAIVGHVTHQASNGGLRETAATPHAITDAKPTPMPILEHRRPERVPRVQLKKHGQ